MAKKKYYVVWKGKAPGVYEDWATAKEQVQGFEGAAFKSFPSRGEAESAFRSGKHTSSSRKPGFGSKPIKAQIGKAPTVGLVVDAACSSNPGPVEYQGIDLSDRKTLFASQVFRQGTNNLGEFLAIVHALAYLKKQGLTTMPIYSDSVTAIGWVKKGKYKTTLAATAANQPLFERLAGAVGWLANNSYTNPIKKWETKSWGENPADYGRKG